MSQQPGFVPVPVQWMQQPQQAAAPNDNIPDRVRVALEVLCHFTSKTMARAAMNDLSIETLPGQSLTKAEINVQATAANTLNDYLLGKLAPDQYENAAGGRGKGLFIRCFVCQNNDAPPAASCQFCRGAGTILVFPAVEKRR